MELLLLLIKNIDEYEWFSFIRNETNFRDEQ